jgi:CheY-like chemotaxis protein
LHGDERYRNPKIVILSALSDPDTQRKAKEAGVLEYWTKPISPDELREGMLRSRMQLIVVMLPEVAKEPSPGAAPTPRPCYPRCSLMAIATSRGMPGTWASCPPPRESFPVIQNAYSALRRDGPTPGISSAEAMPVLARLARW